MYTSVETLTMSDLKFWRLNSLGALGQKVVSHPVTYIPVLKKIKKINLTKKINNF